MLDKISTTKGIIAAKTEILRITIIIASVEAFIMLLLGNISHGLSWYLQAILDTVVLIVVAGPLIYIRVVKPNIDARDKALVEVTQMALHDPLTQLPNRRLLFETLEHLVPKHTRHQMYGSLLFLDLDNFKSINDNDGHSVGDAMLIEVAKRIKLLIRASDIAGRLGGDEFLIYLDQIDTDKDTAKEYSKNKAYKIQQDLIRPFNFSGKTFKIECSIGIRMIGPNSPTANEAISEADGAMYKAKRDKNTSIRFFED